MALTGDFHRLELLRRAMKRIADGGAVALFAQNAAQAIGEYIRYGFAAQTDPYGRPWAPLKRPEARPILRKTDKMFNSFRARPVSRGVAVTAVDYANYQQARRNMVPDPQLGLGPSWTTGLLRVSERTMLGLTGDAP